MDAYVTSHTNHHEPAGPISGKTARGQIAICPQFVIPLPLSPRFRPAAAPNPQIGRGSELLEPPASYRYHFPLPPVLLICLQGQGLCSCYVWLRFDSKLSRFGADGPASRIMASVIVIAYGVILVARCCCLMLDDSQKEKGKEREGRISNWSLCLFISIYYSFRLRIQGHYQKYNLYLYKATISS